jgi:type VI secretion system protein VasG
MEDGEGRSIDFRNTLILLTSNVGTDLIMSMCGDPELLPETEEIAKALRPPLLKVFPPALLGRLIVIPYLPLSPAVMEDIIRLQLGRISARVSFRHGVPFSYGEDVVRLIASRCDEPESGGRMIDAILTNTMLPDISGALLNRLLAGEAVARVHVGVEGSEFTYALD